MDKTPSKISQRFSISDLVVAILFTSYAASLSVALFGILGEVIVSNEFWSLKTLASPFYALVLSLVGMLFALPITLACAITFLWPATRLGLFSNRVPRLISIIITGLFGAAAMLVLLRYQNGSRVDPHPWKELLFQLQTGMVAGSAAGWMWDKFARPKLQSENEIVHG